MLGEMAHDTLVRDFRKIDTRETRIVLVEAGPRILPTFPEDLAAAAERDLRRLGVDVLVNTKVTDISAEGVTAGSETIPARVVLWTAGNAASPLARGLGVPLDRAGRVPVEADLSVAGHPEILVTGDLALFTHQNDRPLPGTAPVAMQQGAAAARNVLRSVRGEPRQAFTFRDRGSPAVIGRASAIIDFGRVHLTGLVAWVLWLFIHIFFLVGFDNRILVMWQWAWSFFTHQRGARLITGPVGPGGVAAMTLPSVTGPVRPTPTPDGTGAERA
jgi:NADH dehydrogenase